MDLARASTVVLLVATASHNKALVVSTAATSTVATSTVAASTATASTVALDPSNTRSPVSTARRLVTVDSHSPATASRALAVTGLKPVMAVLRPHKTKAVTATTAGLRTTTTTSTTSTVARRNTPHHRTVGLLAVVPVDTLDRASMVGNMAAGTATHRSLGGRWSIWEKHFWARTPPLRHRPWLRLELIRHD
jgi:hypothetical protein